MRLVDVAILASLLVACKPQPYQIGSGEPECYLNVTYVRDTELSRDVWEHLSRHSEVLVDDEAFAASLWYDEGGGRAGFVYLADCASAQAKLAQALEQFARTAETPEIAEQLRTAQATIVTQAQFEDSEPI